MTADSLPYLDPEVLRRISHLEFEARQVVEGFLSGRHKSRFSGASLEFAQHREYVMGDDLRHLDWKVWGRADRLTIKQYEAETNLEAHLLIDVSASMDYGAGLANKLEFTRVLSATLAYVLLRQSDAVGMTFLDSEPTMDIAARTSRAQLRVLLHSLVTAKASKPGDIPGALSQWLPRAGSRGVRILVSDLLCDADALFRVLGPLRKRGHDVIVFHVLHDDEWEFPFNELTEFLSSESSDRLSCDPKSVRAEYRRLIREHVAKFRHGCLTLGVDYRMTRTSESLDGILAQLLGERMRS